MQARALVLAVAAVVWTVGMARADGEEFARSGGFVGGGFLGALNETDFADLTGDSLGFEVRGGYRFHRHFAVEGQVTYTHNIGGDFGATEFNFETVTGTVNLKGYLLPGRVQPYALVGIGGTHAHLETEVFDTTVSEDSTNAFTFRGGGGIDIYLAPSVHLYTEATYLLLTGDFDGDGMIPIVFGAQYRF
jgi:opacity protein-like surface antigen